MFHSSLDSLLVLPVLSMLQLNDKDQGMLEERIKRSAKTKPASAPPAEKKVSPKDDKPKMVAKVPPTQKTR